MVTAAFCRVCLAILIAFAALMMAPAFADGLYGDTYTDDELAALDRVLHAANMTRNDLTFNKHYAKGFECMPIVLDMMHDPLLIAAVMDGYAESSISRSGAAYLDRPRAALTEAMHFYSFSPLSEGARWPDRKSHWAPVASPPKIETREQLINYLADLLSTRVEFPFTEIEYEVLRAKLPAAMAWHEVAGRPFPAYSNDDVEEYLKDKPKEYIFELASRIPILSLYEAYMDKLGTAIDVIKSLPLEIFPSDHPTVIGVAQSLICLGSPGDDVHENQYYTILIDPGGNDRYINCRLGSANGAHYPEFGSGRFGLFVDLGGDDIHDCRDIDVNLGAAVLGVAAFYDLGGGNDRYYAGNVSLGAAAGGIAVFYDDGGSDTYEGKVFTQGAAGFGIGIMLDASAYPAPEIPTDVETPDPIDIADFGNDRYFAWSNAQAFARTLGVAICENERGNDVYHAGGVYLHAPLFADRYQSFSQGFAIGERDIDYAGGMAFLIDRAGNDRYLGDIYNQGVGYWYSAGLLWDGGGNDSYEMTQYGQGSGIHLAVGGLVDASGTDTYVMHSGLGQGGSHDFAASILHDRGGDDHYMGMTSCNGTGLTNSVGLHIDRSGNDTYAGRREGGVNWGRPERGFPSIGILIDLAGADEYLGIMKDGGIWRQSDIAIGIDVAPSPEAAKPEFAAAPDRPTGAAKIPEICFYKGTITQEVFDELWEIAIRWEVGDNRYIVPEARRRLWEFGASVLPYMEAKMDSDASSLAYRAYLDIFQKLADSGHREAISNLAKTNAASENETRMRIALYLIGEMKLIDAEDAVLARLGSGDPAIVRRAIGVLTQLKSTAANETLMEMLHMETDEATLRSAFTALLTLEADCYADVRPLFAHPQMSVREALINLLSARMNVYGDTVKSDFINTARYHVQSENAATLESETLNSLAVPIAESASAQASGNGRVLTIEERKFLEARTLRTLIGVYLKSDVLPDAETADSAASLLSSEDWGVRADAARLIRKWQKAKGADYTAIKPALDALRKMLLTETDPYVLFAGEN